MADKSVQVTLTTAFQKLTTLVAAKRVADGFPPFLAWHFREIRVQVSKDSTGVVTLQKGSATSTNPFIELEGGEAQPYTSGTRLNNNSLEGWWAKSTVSAATEKLNILFQE